MNPFKIAVAVVGIVLWSKYLVWADWYAVSPAGSLDVLILRDILLLPACTFFLAISVFAYRCIVAVRRGPAFLALSLLGGLIGSTLVAARIGSRIRMASFSELANRSMPLVEAIRKFERVRGHPPEYLEALVPEFLPSVPQTGIGAYPKYRYNLGDGRADHGNPWVLYVFTPTGWLDFDKFFYYPLQNYPPHIDGNGIEQIGEWAYMHE